jgi:hypothetical protein
VCLVKRRAPAHSLTHALTHSRTLALTQSSIGSRRFVRLIDATIVGENARLIVDVDGGGSGGSGESASAEIDVASGMSVRLWLCNDVAVELPPPPLTSALSAAKVEKALKGARTRGKVYWRRNVFDQGERCNARRCERADGSIAENNDLGAACAD